MYPSRTAARLLFIPTPVKTFIGPLPGTPTDHLGLQSWPSSSPSLPLTITICHPSSSHIYCSIASFDLFYFFYILSFFLFFFFSREGRSLFYADWCTRWWMTFHFTKPRHSPIPCQPKAGSVLIFTQDLPHEGSMLQAGIKYTMRTEAMYVWELCDGKQTYLLLLLPLAADERPNVTFFFRYSPVDYGRASDYWAAILWYFPYHTHTFSHTIFLFNRIALKK